jgi:hypothetical protein
MTEHTRQQRTETTEQAKAVAADHPQGQPSRSELRERSNGLVGAPNILDHVASALSAMRFAGPTWPALLVVLAMFSRNLPKPVSVVMQGESSSGKSYTIDKALKFFSPEASYRLTAMSNKALAYTKEDFRHRMIVVCEAKGLAGDSVAYLIRSLLSEGRIDYLVTDFKRHTTIRIQKEGPTGLITSTAGHVDYELGTRLLSIPSDDSRALTDQIVMAEAEAAEAGEAGEASVDLAPFHALDQWIASGPRNVVIPFATQIATGTDGKAVRMRRDFSAVLGLVRAHALLHQANREINEHTQVIATVDDYRAVHDLVSEIVARASGRTVPPQIRELVSAVAERKAWTPDSGRGIPINVLAEALDVHRSTISRRAAGAITLGYLTDLGSNGKRQFALGEAMPEDAGVLPDPDSITG